MRGEERENHPSEWAYNLAFAHFLLLSAFHPTRRIGRRLLVIAG
jgi:hypothetical protein